MTWKEIGKVVVKLTILMEMDNYVVNGTNYGNPDHWQYLSQFRDKRLPLTSEKEQINAIYLGCQFSF